MVRHHYLDWLRTLMIMLVVFAHIELTIGPLGKIDENGDLAEWIVDDKERGTNPHSEYATRWISFCRPWCLPLLFWISGAALGLGDTSHAVLKSVPKLLLITIIGVLFNAAIWHLGPADPNCSPFSPCVGKGILFDFSICADSGLIFPLVFQMWYTVALSVLLLWNWPLLICYGSHQDKSGSYTGMEKAGFLLFIQCMLACAVYIFGASVTPEPTNTATWLCSWEVVFQLLQFVTFTKYRPECVPLRAVHYALGFVSVMEFAGTTFMHEGESLSAGFGMYSIVGFNKFFVLGLSMLRCQKCSRFGEVSALASRQWPMVVLALTLFSPSTNWYRGGNLTFPYYPLALDRYLYIGYAVTAVFIVDRVGRFELCNPLPDSISKAGLVLYLLHPTLMQFLLQYFPSLRYEVAQLWLIIVAIGMAPALLIECKKGIKLRPRKAGMSLPLTSS